LFVRFFINKSTPLKYFGNAPIESEKPVDYSHHREHNLTYLCLHRFCKHSTNSAYKITPYYITISNAGQEKKTKNYTLLKHFIFILYKQKQYTVTAKASQTNLAASLTNNIVSVLESLSDPLHTFKNNHKKTIFYTQHNKDLNKKMK